MLQGSHWRRVPAEERRAAHHTTHQSQQRIPPDPSHGRHHNNGSVLGRSLGQASPFMHSLVPRCPDCPLLKFKTMAAAEGIVVANIKWNAGAVTCTVRITLVVTCRGWQWQQTATIACLPHSHKQSHEPPLLATMRRHQYRSCTTGRCFYVPFHIGDHCIRPEAQPCCHCMPLIS